MIAAAISTTTAPLTPMLIRSNRLPSLSVVSVGVKEVTVGDTYNIVLSVGTVELTVGEFRCRIVGEEEEGVLVVVF